MDANNVAGFSDRAIFEREFPEAWAYWNDADDYLRPYDLVWKAFKAGRNAGVEGGLASSSRVLDLVEKLDGYLSSPEQIALRDALLAALGVAPSQRMCGQCSGKGYIDSPAMRCACCGGTGTSGVAVASAPRVLGQALDALETARAAIEPLTGAQIRLHRIPVDTAVRIENAITSVRAALGVMEVPRG